MVPGCSTANANKVVPSTDDKSHHNQDANFSIDIPTISVLASI